MGSGYSGVCRELLLVVNDYKLHPLIHAQCLIVLMWKGCLMNVWDCKIYSSSATVIVSL